MKIGFLMCMIFVSVPYIAHVFNGFSYVTNRWCWALTMLMSYIFVKMYPEFFHLSRRQRTGILLVLILWAIYICTDSYAKSGWNLFAIGLVLGIWLIFTVGYRFLCKKQQLIQGLLLTGICAGIVLNIYYCFCNPAIEDVNFSQFADMGKAYEKIVTPGLNAMSRMEDISEHRYDQCASGIYQNSQMLTGLNGGQFFFSLANGDVSRFQNELYPNKPLSQNFYNFNSRSFPMKLLSMKYFIGSAKYAPYGFEKVRQVRTPSVTDSDEMRKVYIYEDSDALPFAYTYDSAISPDTYEKMTVMERQQALLQGVVLKDTSLKECIPEDTSREISYTITPVSDCEIFDHRIKAKEAMATCLLTFQGLPKSELSLVFDNLQYLAVNRRHKYSDEEWAALSFFEQREITIKDEKITNEFEIYFDAEVNDFSVRKEIQMVTDRNNFYGGRHNFLSNIGYSEEPVTQILVTFQKKGSYAYDDLSLYCQPMDRLEDYTAHLKEDEIEDLKIDYDNVSCRVNLEEPKALVFSIPYHKGWKAYVDGKETEIKKANTMFMTLELNTGEHEIQLHYEIPYFKLFLCFSMIGVLLLGGMLFRDFQPKKNRK